jgi:hypothetical protein
VGERKLASLDFGVDVRLGVETLIDDVRDDRATGDYPDRDEHPHEEDWTDGRGLCTRVHTLAMPAHFDQALP